MVIANSAPPASQSHAKPIIQIVEVSAKNAPTSDILQYKCRITVQAAGVQQRRKDCMTRLQPSWLVDVKQPGDCEISLTLLYREGGLGQPWQEAGTIEFPTHGLFREKSQR